MVVNAGYGNPGSSVLVILKMLEQAGGGGGGGGMVVVTQTGNGPPGNALPASAQSGGRSPNAPSSVQVMPERSRCITFQRRIYGGVVARVLMATQEL